MANMSSGHVHIYIAAAQPATCWTENLTGTPHTFRFPGNRLLWCWSCNRKRPAKNLTVRPYYDCTMFFCAQGKGCKSAKELGEKKRKLFLARSAGQKRRWAKKTLDS